MADLEIVLLKGEKQPYESTRAILACNAFLRLGPGRTVPKLLKTFEEIQANGGGDPPTKSIGTLGQWQSRFNWAQRAAAYDASFEEQRDEAFEDAFKDGLSVPYKRIEELTAIFEDIAPHIMTPLLDNDGKPILHPESGDPLMLVDTRVVAQVRGVLDDIAQETGGRVKKIAPTTPDGKKPLPVTGLNYFAAKPDPEG